MILKISNKLEFKESNSENNPDGNEFSFDWNYDADSEEGTPEQEDGLAVKDFKFSNANKFVYELKKGNTFDLLLQQDVIKSDSIDKITSVHIFCYESSKIRPFRIPIKFELTLEELNTPLGKMSEFSLGNVNELATDIRISGIVVEENSRATLVIIVATKD